MAKQDPKLSSEEERLKKENKADEKPPHNGKTKEGDIKTDIELHQRVFLFHRNKKPD